MSLGGKSLNKFYLSVGSRNLQADTIISVKPDKKEVEKALEMLKFLRSQDVKAVIIISSEGHPKAETIIPSKEGWKKFSSVEDMKKEKEEIKQFGVRLRTAELLH